jgi:hypothetical protein
VPVVYQIDGDKKIIRTRCLEPLTVEEVLEHFRTLERDPKGPERLDVLLDVSAAPSVPLSENLRQVTREIGRVRSRVQFGTCAIVASKDAFFGKCCNFENADGNCPEMNSVWRCQAQRVESLARRGLTLRS